MVGLRDSQERDRVVCLLDKSACADDGDLNGGNAVLDLRVRAASGCCAVVRGCCGMLI